MKTDRKRTGWITMRTGIRMKASRYLMGFLLAITAAVNLPSSTAQDGPGASASEPAKPQSTETSDKSAKVFDEVADKALVAMRARADELKIKGVAVVAYIEGDSVASWSSKMVVVGSMKTTSSQKGPGSNLLAIAYSKAAEMADTLKDSGSGVRSPMKGEFGWQGGLVKKGKAGYLIAAFSGGKSEDDVKVSQAGLDILATAL